MTYLRIAPEEEYLSSTVTEKEEPYLKQDPSFYVHNKSFVPLAPWTKGPSISGLLWEAQADLVSQACVQIVFGMLACLHPFFMVGGCLCWFMSPLTFLVSDR